MQNLKKASVFSLQLSRILITSLPYNHEGQLFGIILRGHASLYCVDLSVAICF